MSFGDSYNPYAAAYGLYNKNEEWMKTQGMVEFLESLGGLSNNVDDWPLEWRQRLEMAIFSEQYLKEAEPSNGTSDSFGSEELITRIQGPPAVRALRDTHHRMLVIFSRFSPEQRAQVKQVVKFLPIAKAWPHLLSDFDD